MNNDIESMKRKFIEFHCGCGKSVVITRKQYNEYVANHKKNMEDRLQSLKEDEESDRNCYGHKDAPSDYHDARNAEVLVSFYKNNHSLELPEVLEHFGVFAIGSCNDVYICQSCKVEYSALNDKLEKEYKAAEKEYKAAMEKLRKQSQSENNEFCKKHSRG